MKVPAECFMDRCAHRVRGSSLSLGQGHYEVRLYHCELSVDGPWDEVVAGNCNGCRVPRVTRVPDHLRVSVAPSGSGVTLQCVCGAALEDDLSCPTRSGAGHGMR